MIVDRFFGVAIHDSKICLQLCVVLELCGNSLADEIFDEATNISWDTCLRYLLEIAQVKNKLLLHRALDCILH